MQLTDADEEEFISLDHDTVVEAMFSEWGKKFKIHSMKLKLASQTTIIERKTYNLLEWLGDVGGLYDALKIIGSAIVAPISAL